LAISLGFSLRGSFFEKKSGSSLWGVSHHAVDHAWSDVLLITAEFTAGIALVVHSLWAWWWAHGRDHAVHHATYFISGIIALFRTSIARGIHSLWAWWWAS